MNFLFQLGLVGLVAFFNSHTSPIALADSSVDIQAASVQLAHVLPDLSPFYTVRSIKITDDEDIIYLAAQDITKRHLPLHIRGTTPSTDQPSQSPQNEEYCTDVGRPDYLGIQPDFFTWTDTREMDVNRRKKEQKMFSSRLTFPNVKSVYTEVLNSDKGQLAKLCKDAYMQMTQLKEYQNLRRDSTNGLNSVPSIMSAMAMDNKIWFSSSMKGSKGSGSIVYLDSLQGSGGGFLSENVKWNECLTECAQVSGAPGHKSGANCGECMISWKYFQENPTHARYEGAVFVSVWEDKTKQKAALPVDPDIILIADPCDIQEKDGVILKFGCATPIAVAGGSYIHKGEVDFRPYRIGRKEGELTRDYQKKARVYTSDFVKINPGWVRVP